MDRAAHALIRPDRAKVPAIKDGGQAFDDFDTQDAPGLGCHGVSPWWPMSEFG